ncbi:unnamed protein product [Danaus chrysippus]|uniref:(African queen) hypothetical protein n=1 Tax=Danaus chrysippus TaxID=151541 RepID=A0A8J2QDQ2_9NEOP|nr:unnamed protein product [Danaus chrysippus]
MNTLFDDADDIQPQLDNEARDKYMYAKPKTVFVFRLPTQYPIVTIPILRKSRQSTYFAKRKKLKKTKKPNTKAPELKEWTYKDQHDWPRQYPDCGGRSQSPVDLPYTPLVKAKESRQLMFLNYDVLPKNLMLSHDGKRIVLYGEWKPINQPLIYGGAAHSRRYLFHSLTLHRPSEHRIGGLQFPMETQVLFISAEYKSFEEAIKASLKDAQAFLGIVNIYKYDNHTQQGLEELLKAGSKRFNTSMSLLPLGFFSPPLQQYACYQGSLTFPPCTESVLWLIRAKALPITRKAMDAASSIFEEDHVGSCLREPQSLNDRRVYYFH